MDSQNLIRAIWSRLKLALDLPSPLTNLRATALLEIESRAYQGVLVYLSCWLGIALSTGIIKSAPNYFSYVTYCLLTLTSVRIPLHFSFTRLVNYSEKAARSIFLILVLSAGLILGVITALTIYIESLAPAFHPMIVVTGVLCTAATLMLSIDPVIRYGMPIVMLSPVTLAFAMTPSSTNFTFSILLLINIVYLINTSRRTHFDYWNGVKARSMLVEQASILEKQSLTDGLTQIPNRLNTQRRLSEDWEKLLKNEAPLTILMVDIDHFKIVNDTFGHLFGDKCLISVAKTLTLIIHEPNFVGRFGGEEFIVMLFDVNEDQGFAIAERLRKSIGAINLHCGSESVNLSCSIGLATVTPPVSVSNVDAIVNLADAALYQAKEQGRNRVVAATTQLYC